MTKIWIVDAFTDQPYKGNPAAVMIVDVFPEDEICQSIAAEMNLSETVFLKQLGDDYFHIRWFTPKVEVKLCGHATLAAAYILFSRKQVKGDQLKLDSLSGSLLVKKKEQFLVLNFPLQRTGPQLEKPYYASLLNLGDSLLNVVQAYDDIIIELDNAKTVKNFNLETDKVKQIDCRGLIITARGEGEYDFVSRFFAPRIGVIEDPVTGSAHCKLADYWSQRLGKNDFLAKQLSERSGIVVLKIKGDRVELKGQAVTIMEGEWKVKIY